MLMAPACPSELGAVYLPFSPPSLLIPTPLITTTILSLSSLACLSGFNRTTPAPSLIRESVELASNGEQWLLALNIAPSWYRCPLFKGALILASPDKAMTHCPFLIL